MACTRWCTGCQKHHIHHHLWRALKKLEFSIIDPINWFWQDPIPGSRWTDEPKGSSNLGWLNKVTTRGIPHFFGDAILASQSIFEDLRWGLSARWWIYQQKWVVSTDEAYKLKITWCSPSTMSVKLSDLSSLKKPMSLWDVIFKNASL